MKSPERFGRRSGSEWRPDFIRHAIHCRGRLHFEFGMADTIRRHGLEFDFGAEFGGGDVFSCFGEGVLEGI